MPHDMAPVAPHRLSRFDETRIDLPEAHFGDAGEEWRGAGGERNDGRPDPDRRSDKEPRQRQERHEENNEGRGSESIHDRRKRSARPLAPAGCGPRRPRKSDFTTVAANPRRSRPAFHTPSAATRRRPRFAEKGEPRRPLQLDDLCACRSSQGRRGRSGAIPSRLKTTVL
jgi:hypothetical protein